MIWYHTIRVFLKALVFLPFWVIGSILDMLGYLLQDVGGFLINDYDYRLLNIVRTHGVIKKNIDSGEFDKWTGRRIKG